MFAAEAEEALAVDRFSPVFQSLKEGLPLERIEQEKFFYNSLFYINQNVLIPRNETEVLVEKTIEICHKNKVKKIAEVGVGSGCILLSVLKEASLIEEAFAIDISPKALEIFEINRFRCEKAFPSGPMVHAILGDRMSELKGPVDIIVTNPPYIDLESDGDKVHWQANRYEPKEALYLNNEGYDQWFDTLFAQAREKLSDKGVFMMEGHEDKWESVSKTAKKYFDKIEIVKDLTGVDRFLMAGDI